MKDFFNSPENPYAAYRNPVYAKRGMVATTQPLASQAGIEIMAKGGNAVDAAIAAGATLTITEPTSNGIGGDAFALIWINNSLHGLNSSGPSPQNATLGAMKARGYSEMPHHGWEPVTVPGIPAAWAALSKRFGKLPLIDVLQPAIRHAANGFAVSQTVALDWNNAFQIYKKRLHGEQFSHWFDTFALGGSTPRPGEMWSSPAHAKTLESIGTSYAENFYRGEIADKIAAFSKANGGFLSKQDLEAFQPEWVNPITTSYRGFDVWEIPPNGQGLSTLLALNILEGMPPLDRTDEQTFHHAIEAIKLAMTDGDCHITDSRFMSTKIEDLLSKAYASKRRSLISDHAIEPYPGNPQPGGTVYLATADSEGNMVSYIQSNYEGFGSGLVVPNTGIALQNRGNNFSLDPSHINRLVPNKRTFHTIIPGFLTKDGHPVGPFGVMGGFNQPQGHVQVITNTIDCTLNPQAALDAPRLRWVKGKNVLLEPTFPTVIADALAERGHQIEFSTKSGLFGRGQIIWRNNESGVLIGGTESRADGTIAVL